MVYVEGIEVEDAFSATPTTDVDRPLMVALGDSFISGEGADRYLKGTGSKWNTCHRANAAYPYLVAEELNYRLVNAACSGATTTDIIDHAQYPDSPSDVLGGSKQLDVLEASSMHDSPDDVGVVVLSIGGNDAGFSKIVLTCLDEKACQRHDREWMQRLEGIAPRLKQTYDAIAARVPHARRVVMTYPQVMVPIGCAPGLSPAEIRWVNKRFLPRLDSIITFQAGIAGFEVVDNMDVFIGARICEKRQLKQGRAAHVFTLSQIKGKARLDLAAITRGSFHPTPLGHRLLEAQLLQQLQSESATPEPCVRDCPLAPPPNPPEPPPGWHAPFPADTPCAGEEIDTDRVVSISTKNRTVELSAHPRSGYCFRNWEDTWHKRKADVAGVAKISTKPIFKGDTVSVEVLTQASAGTWARTVLIPAPTDPIGKATFIGHFVFWIILLVVGSLGLAALPWFMSWRKGRRLRRGTKNSLL